MTNPWNDANTARLRDLWCAAAPSGKPLHSAKKIGNALGFTKNAIVGKAVRIGLPPRESPLRPKGSGKRPNRQPSLAVRALHEAARITRNAARVTQAEAMAAIEAEEARVTQAAIADERRAITEAAEAASYTGRDRAAVRPSRACEWIDGGTYCGAPRARGSYCAEHAARAYVARVGRTGGVFELQPLRGVL